MNNQLHVFERYARRPEERRVRQLLRVLELRSGILPGVCLASARISRAAKGNEESALRSLKADCHTRRFNTTKGGFENKK